MDKNDIFENIRKKYFDSLSEENELLTNDLVRNFMQLISQNNKHLKIQTKSSLI